jgi:hypothetical protein
VDARVDDGAQHGRRLRSGLEQLLGRAVEEERAGDHHAIARR